MGNRNRYKDRENEKMPANLRSNQFINARQTTTNTKNPPPRNARVRICVPAPHCALHCDHSLHSPTKAAHRGMQSCALHFRVSLSAGHCAPPYIGCVSICRYRCCVLPAPHRPEHAPQPSESDTLAAGNITVAEPPGAEVRNPTRKSTDPRMRLMGADTIVVSEVEEDSEPVPNDSWLDNADAEKARAIFTQNERTVALPSLLPSAAAASLPLPLPLPHMRS